MVSHNALLCPAGEHSDLKAFSHTLACKVAFMWVQKLFRIYSDTFSPREGFKCRVKNKLMYKALKNTKDIGCVDLIEFI